MQVLSLIVNIVVVIIIAANLLGYMNQVSEEHSTYLQDEEYMNRHNAVVAGATVATLIWTVIYVTVAAWFIYLFVMLRRYLRESKERLSSGVTNYAQPLPVAGAVQSPGQVVLGDQAAYYASGGPSGYNPMVAAPLQPQYGYNDNKGGGYAPQPAPYGHMGNPSWSGDNEKSAPPPSYQP